jgi:hypothetical protein
MLQGMMFSDVAGVICLPKQDLAGQLTLFSMSEPFKVDSAGIRAAFTVSVWMAILLTL